MNRRTFLGGAAGVFALSSAVSGCKDSGARSRLEGMIPVTEAAILELLVGRPEPVRRPGDDPPLLARGVREHVEFAVDIDGFVRATDGKAGERDIQAVARRVARDLEAALKRERFTFASVPFGGVAPNGSAPIGGAGSSETGPSRVLLVLVEPLTQDGGSPEDRARGRGRTLLLARVTITQAGSPDIVARREFYTGYDIQTIGR